jgi:hypothetical protein
MALTTVSFQTTFQYDQSPKTFKFVDDTDYAGQSVPLANVTGVFKIVDPLGNTIYNNTNHSAPDINPAVSLINSITIALPLDSDGLVIQGEYEITYTVEDSVDAVSVSQENKPVLAYVSPTISLLLTADCVKPLLKSTDSTGYTVGGVTPTPTRVHTIQYPPSTGQADLTGTTATVETSVLYTVANASLQYTSTLTSTLTYDFTTYTVTDSITGSTYSEVSCDGQLCEIYCCVRAEWNRYTSNLNVNKVRAEEALANWSQMVGLMENIRTALECGKGTDVSEYVTRIQTIGECESGCDCDDGTPQLVTGLGGGTGTVIVDSSGTPVTVTSVTVGSTTTYTVAIDAAFVTKVNNSYNATVVAGTNITVTTVTDSNGNKEYTVSAAPNTVPNILSFKMIITPSAGSLPSVTHADVTLTGDAFDNSPQATNQWVGTVSEWQSNDTHFLIAGFWANQGALEYKADMNIIDMQRAVIGEVGSAPVNVLPQIYDNFPTMFSLKFIDITAGNTVTGNVIDQFESIKLQITLTA